jgi:hypothetical protein
VNFHLSAGVRVQFISFLHKKSSGTIGTVSTVIVTNRTTM